MSCGKLSWLYRRVILSVSNWFGIVSLYRRCVISAAEDVWLRSVKCGRVIMRQHVQRASYKIAVVQPALWRRRQRDSRTVLCPAATGAAVISTTAPAWVDGPCRVPGQAAATPRSDRQRTAAVVVDYDVYYGQVRPAGVCITLRILVGTYIVRLTSQTTPRWAPWQRPTRRRDGAGWTAETPAPSSETCWRGPSCPTTTTRKRRILDPHRRQQERNSCDLCHVTSYGWTRDLWPPNQPKRRPVPCAVLQCTPFNDHRMHIAYVSFLSLSYYYYYY